MNSMNPEQEITYYRNGQEFSHIHPSCWERIPESVQAYIRHLQPFTKVGQQMSIPFFQDGRYSKSFRSSTVQSVERIGNSLRITTRNSRYEIWYKGIDLERMLIDGEGNGVNASNEFPARVV